jgi:hypothetical protein
VMVLAQSYPIHGGDQLDVLQVAAVGPNLYLALAVAPRNTAAQCEIVVGNGSITLSS